MLSDTVKRYYFGFGSQKSPFTKPQTALAFVGFTRRFPAAILPLDHILGRSGNSKS